MTDQQPVKRRRGTAPARPPDDGNYLQPDGYQEPEREDVTFTENIPEAPAEEYREPAAYDPRPVQPADEDTGPAARGWYDASGGYHEFGEEENAAEPEQPAYGAYDPSGTVTGYQEQAGWGSGEPTVAGYTGYEWSPQYYTQPDAVQEPAPSPEGFKWPLPVKQMLLLLTGLAAAFIFISFALNWELNRGSFEVVLRSEVLKDLGTIEGSMIALAVSAFIVALPELKGQMPFKADLRHLFGTVGGILLFIWIVSGDGGLVVDILVQSFVLGFYSAPLLFGLYGVIHRKPVHIVIYAMFMFFVAGGMKNNSTEPLVLVVFALFFLLSIEVGESSIRCHVLLEEKKLSEEHMAGFTDRYLRHLAIFMTAAFFLTLFVINLPAVLGVLGLKAVAASIELGSVYGQVVTAVAVFGTLGILRFLHDRGYTKPWIARGRKYYGILKARLVKPAEEVAYTTEYAAEGRY